MNTLIVYGTKYGCAEKCANLLAQKLSGKIDIKNLKNTGELDLSQYDSIIIGGSIYVGRIRKEVSDFCIKNIEVLQKKKTGLFICGMQTDAFEAELNASFPKDLLESAAAKDCFGGEFILKKVNFFERTIVKMIAKTDKDMLNISEVAIDSFAKQMIAAS